MSSARLPGKVMLELSGKPVIEQIFHQLSFSKKLADVVLATSTSKEDEVLTEWAKNNNIKYFTGSLDNVLQRFYESAKKYRAEIIVRITGDCPLIDPEVIDKMIEQFLNSDLDYLTNNNPPTFPDGLDVEIFTFSKDWKFLILLDFVVWLAKWDKLPIIGGFVGEF